LKEADRTKFDAMTAALRKRLRSRHAVETGMEIEPDRRQQEDHLDNIDDFPIAAVAVVRDNDYLKDDMYNDPIPAFLKHQEKKKTETKDLAERATTQFPWDKF
jgi:hypothetical protein